MQELTRGAVLVRLQESPGSYVSGEEMASEMGVSRAAIWKLVSSLRADGYEIESSPKRGYRLIKSPDLLDPDLIRMGLATKTLGQEIHYYREVGSTNAVAREMAGSMEDGTVVLAEVQKEGRGRLAREWASPRGGVWMSLLLKPPLPPALAPRINMAVSVGVARALRDLYGLDVGIKWPNDLVVGDLKLCGILTEIQAEMDRLGYVVVGIGINANLDPGIFPGRWRATSLVEQLGRAVSRNDLVRKVLEEAERSYSRIDAGFDQIYSEWCALSRTLDGRVKITSMAGEFCGVAKSLEPDGGLLVETPEGSTRKVLAGDCVHLRNADFGP